MLSANFIQQIAMAASKDGLAHPDVIKLSKLGSEGRWANNVPRDFLSKLPKGTMHNAVSTIQVPMKNGGIGNAWSWQPLDIMYPHKVFSILYHSYHEHFESRMVGTFDTLRKFWEVLADIGCPQYAQHPVRSRANHRTHGIPIKLHGDGVPVAGVGKSWGKSLNIYTFSGLLCASTTIDAMFPMGILYPLLAIANSIGSTRQILWREFIWSLHWAWLGENPTEDSSGRPMRRATKWLAGGYFLVVIDLH